MPEVRDEAKNDSGLVVLRGFSLGAAIFESGWKFDWKKETE